MTNSSTVSNSLNRNTSSTEVNYSDLSNEVNLLIEKLIPSRNNHFMSLDENEKTAVATTLLAAGLNFDEVNTLISSLSNIDNES